MEIYWSAVARLRNNPDATVEDTIPIRLLVKRINTEVILPSMPPAVIAPPKHMHRQSAKWYSSFPTYRVWQPTHLSLHCLSPVGCHRRACPCLLEKCSKTCYPLPCYLAQQIRLEYKCKDSGQCGGDKQSNDRGTLRAIKTPVTTGTIISHQEILNLESSACMYSVI